MLARILHATLVLDGYDPGPANEMLGANAADIANGWERQYEGILAASESPTGSTQPGMRCIEALWEGGWLRFLNTCSVGVEVIFRTESPDDHLGCESRPPSTKYPCATYVGAGKKQSQLQTIWGDGPMHVYWVAWKAPGGAGDVRLTEKGYGKVICTD